MNTKTIITTMVAGIGYVALGQVEMPNAPQWQITLRVGSEDGRSVPNANTFASYYIQPPPGTTEASSRKTGLTDTNGFVTLTARSGPRVWCAADKAGYYSSSGLELAFTNKLENRWQPWNETGEIILKRIINPIPMYAKSILQAPPVANKPVGHDFMSGNWVAPYGNGQVIDIILARRLDRKAKHDYDDILTISFPNVGDGIQVFTSSANDRRSGLRSPHEAPAEGYQPQLVRETTEHPGQPLKFEYDESRNYFIRVRTILDEKGNVKSALYGKIYGDFMQFTYYLNPTPNDRNIEFDPKQNLLTGLKSFEQVTAP